MVISTPPMGWNSWNTFAAKISDKLIRETADLFDELGLAEAGYKYVVIDDCWSLHERDPKTNRIVADPEKFPEGMKALADYIHSKGLKFGMYSCAGVRTCGNYPGSFGHEYLDARTFAEFGVDYLKYDYCFRAIDNHAPLYYRRMGQALRTCGRDIVFSACNWGAEDVWSWIRSTGAHLYRSTGDIFDNFPSMRDIAVSQLPKLCYSAPNCFNDMDMLTVGMFGKGNVGNAGAQTVDEYKVQFALWCLMGSPLMLGCDLRTVRKGDEIHSLITNKDLIAINQDPAALQAFDVKYSWGNKDLRVIARLLDNGDTAIGFFNFDDKSPRSATVMLEDLGFPYESGMVLDLRDLFTGETFTSGRDEFVMRDVPSHGCRVFRATPRKVQ